MKTPPANGGSDRSWFRAHYLGTPIPTYLWRCVGEDFLLLDFNEAASAITRGRIAGYVGMKALKFYADRPDIVRDFRECRSGRTIMRRETPYRFKSTGEERILAVVFVYLDPDLIIVHTEDITGLKRAEENLRESEEKYRTLVEMFPHTVAIFQDGRVAFANRAAARMLGYDDEEGIIGLDVMAPVPPEEVDRLYGIMTGLLAGDPAAPNAFQAGLRRRDGAPITIEVYATAINFRGRPAVQLVMTDITERQRAEAALRESEERFRAVWEHAPVGICLTDRRGVYNYVNQAYCDIYGYRPEELVGRSFFDAIMAPGHPRADRERYASYFDNPVYTPLSEAEIFVRKDGRPIVVQYTSDFVRQGGRADYMVTMNIDITERKMAEAALRVSEEKYRLLFDNAVEAITSFDYDGRVTLMNRAAASYLGGTPESYIGKAIEDIFPPSQAERFKGSIRRVIATGASFSSEASVLLPRGPRWFRNNLQPVIGPDGKVRLTLLMATDIHAEKQIRIRNEARYNLLERLRRAKDIDACLECCCQAIAEAHLFQRAVLTLHDRDRKITNLGQVGLDDATVRAASQAPAPDPDLAARMTREEYQIGRSFFIPVESGIFGAPLDRQIPQAGADGHGANPWLLGDELFTPIRGEDDRAEGWLSVDTPCDGLRPTPETVSHLEELIDITSKHVRGLQVLENLREEQVALKEKNIALREIMAQIEVEKSEIWQSVRDDIERVLKPAAERLANSDGTVNQVYLGILKKGLSDFGRGTGPMRDVYLKLSDREREICEMIVNGVSTKQIADALSIAEATVKKHREAIRRKLNLTGTKVSITSALRSQIVTLSGHIPE